MPDASKNPIGAAAGQTPAPQGNERIQPGDEAPPGTPGTGENVCKRCGGKGRLEGGQTCPDCNGTGHVTTGIGGA